MYALYIVDFILYNAHYSLYIINSSTVHTQCKYDIILDDIYVYQEYQDTVHCIPGIPGYYTLYTRYNWIL